MERKANNSADMKRKNRCLILRMIREGAISRAEIARRAGLTRAAVTVIVEGLIRDGLVIEGDTVASDIGRRPTMLGIAPRSRYMYGVELLRNGAAVGLADLGGKILERRELGYEGDRADDGIRASETIKRIAETVAELAEKHSVGRCETLGVGVSAPGPVDIVGGRILDPPHLKLLHGFPIARELERQLGMRVFLEKDANVLALAEKNSRRDVGSFLYLTADNGLGGGFVKDGTLYRGENGFGMEIGHISVDMNGGRCRCGNRGCAELYASIPSIMRHARRAGVPAESWAELAALACDRDALCAETVGREAEVLTAVCVSAVNVLEPELIVLGQQLGGAGEGFARLLEERIAERAMTRRHHRVRVSPSVLDEGSGLSAAAGLAAEYFFLEGEPCDDNH